MFALVFWWWAPNLTHHWKTAELKILLSIILDNHSFRGPVDAIGVGTTDIVYKRKFKHVLKPVYPIEIYAATGVVDGIRWCSCHNCCSHSHPIRVHWVDDKNFNFFVATTSDNDLFDRDLLIKVDYYHACLRRCTSRIYVDTRISCWRATCGATRLALSPLSTICWWWIAS